MTPEQKFISEGATYFGHRLIYRNQDVGVLSASGLALNAHGEATLKTLETITDVVVKEVKVVKPKKAVVVDEADLDALLAE